VGFLKGCWSSLHHLRVHINNQRDLVYATLWVITCIHLHNFAMAHEGGENIDVDTFFIEGQQLMEQERQEREEWA